ncbi:MAG: hypothetical protein AAFX09_11295 [Pseudomonadota bacterium]
MRKTLLVTTACASLFTPGCAVVGATAIAADAAVGTAGFVIGTTGDLAEGTIHALTPLGPDDDDDDDEGEDSQD